MYAKIVHIGKVNLDHTFDTKELWEKSTHYPQQRWTKPELISLQHFVFVIPCCIDSVVILKIHLSQNSFLLWQLEFVTPMDEQSMRYCYTTMGSVGILSWVCKMQRSFFASYFWRQQLNIYVGQLVVGKCHSFVKHRGQLVVESVIHSWNTGVSW